MIRYEIVDQCTYTFSDRVRINQDMIRDAFVTWYYGYQINEFLRKAGTPIGLKFTDGPSLTIRDFSADFRAEDVVNGRTMGSMHMKAVAYPDDPKAKDIPEIMEAIMPTDEPLTIYLRPVCPPAEEVPSEPTDDTNPRAQRTAREGCRIRDQISQQDMTMLMVASNQASGEVIEFLKQKCAVMRRKQLDEYCYQLGLPNRIVAAVRVLNNNYLGEKGHDILVQQLYDGRIVPAFSNQFGDVREWAESIKHQRFGYSKYTPTPEEEVVMNAFVVFMSDILQKDK